MSEKKNTFYDSVIITGIKLKEEKELIRLLEKKLGLKHADGDTFVTNDFPVGQSIAFDYCNIIKNIGERGSAQITFLIDSLELFNKKRILTLPEGFGIFYNPNNLKKAKEILSYFKNLFILLPSENKGKEMSRLYEEICCYKNELPKKEQQQMSRYLAYRKAVIDHYLIHHIDYNDFPGKIVYTNEETPLTLADSIKRLVR